MLKLFLGAAMADFEDTSGDDVLTGTTDTDLFRVINGGDDGVSALGGDDIIYFGRGSGSNSFTAADSVDGGTGTDTAVFSGVQSDYSVLEVDGKLVVVDLNAADGNDGADILASVEVLQFKDGTVPASPPAIVALDSGPSAPSNDAVDAASMI